MNSPGHPRDPDDPGDADSLTEAETGIASSFFNDIRNLINILHTHSQGGTESARNVKNILTQHGFPENVQERRDGTWTDFAFRGAAWENEQTWINIYNAGSDELKRLLHRDPYNILIQHIVGVNPFEDLVIPEVLRIETPPQTPRQTPRQGFQTSPSSLTNSMGEPSSNESFGSQSPDSLPRPPMDFRIIPPPPPDSPYRGGRKIKTKKQRKSKSKKYRKISRKRHRRRYKL